MSKEFEPFEIKAEGKVFEFEFRRDGMVYLREEDGSKTNHNQIRGVNTIELAKEVAKEMLYTTGRIKKRILDENQEL